MVGSRGDIWVLSDTNAGNRKQAIALAAAVCAKGGMDYIEKIVERRSLLSYFSLASASAFTESTSMGSASMDSGGVLSPPYPILLVGCGRVAARAALAVKKAARRDAHEIKLVQILKPHRSAGEFDLLIVPRHDRFFGGRVLSTEGALTDVSPRLLAGVRSDFASRYGALSSPIVGVLIGGSNKYYRADGVAVSRIEGLLRSWREQGYSIIGSFSRRTPERLRSYLLSLSARDAGIDFWDGKGDNPYMGILSYADALAVTEDSVNMLSEAYHSGKPSYIIRLSERFVINNKFRHFHGHHCSSGRLRDAEEVLDFSWSPGYCDDLAYSVAEVMRLLR